MNKKTYIWMFITFILFMISLSGALAWYGGSQYRYGFGLSINESETITSTPFIFHLPDECWNNVNMTLGQFLDIVITFNNVSIVPYWYDTKSINTMYENQTGGLYARLNFSATGGMLLTNYNIYCNSNPLSNRPSSLKKEFYFYEDFENLPNWNNAQAGTDPAWDVNADARGQLQNINLPYRLNPTYVPPAFNNYFMEFGRHTELTNTQPILQIHDALGIPCSFLDDNLTCMNITNNISIYGNVMIPDVGLDGNQSFTISTFSFPKIDNPDITANVYQVNQVGVYDRKCGVAGNPYAYEAFMGYGTLNYLSESSIFYPFLEDYEIKCPDGYLRPTVEDYTMYGSSMFDRTTQEVFGVPTSTNYWGRFSLKIFPNMTTKNTIYGESSVNISTITDFSGLQIAVGQDTTTSNKVNKIMRFDEIWAFPVDLYVNFVNSNKSNIYVSTASENPNFIGVSQPRLYRSNGFDYLKLVNNYNNASQMDLKSDATIIDTSNNLTDLHLIYNFTDVDNDTLKSALIYYTYNGTTRSNLTYNYSYIPASGAGNIVYLDNFDNVTNWQNLTGTWSNQGGYLRYNGSLRGYYNLSRNTDGPMNKNYTMRNRFISSVNSLWGLEFNSTQDTSLDKCMFYVYQNVGTNGYAQFINSQGNPSSTTNLTLSNGAYYYTLVVVNSTAIQSVYLSTDTTYTQGEKLDMEAFIPTYCRQDISLHGQISSVTNAVDWDLFSIVDTSMGSDEVNIPTMFNLSYLQFKNYNNIIGHGHFCDSYNCTNASSQQVNILSEVSDTTDPTLTIYSPTATTYINYTTLKINFTATDAGGVDTKWYYNGTGLRVYTIPHTISITNGTHNFRFYANDTYGNVANTNITFINDINGTTPISPSLSDINITCTYPCIFKDDFSYSNYVDRNCWYGSTWRLSNSTNLLLNSYSYLYHHFDFDSYGNCGASTLDGNILTPFSIEFNLKPLHMTTSNKYGVVMAIRGDNGQYPFMFAIKNITGNNYLIEIFRSGIPDFNNFENNNIGLLNTTSGNHRYKFVVDTTGKKFDFYIDGSLELSQAQYYKDTNIPFGVLLFDPNGNEAYLDNVLIVHGDETNETIYSNYTTPTSTNSSNYKILDWSHFLDENGDIIQCYYKSFTPTTKTFADGSSYTMGSTQLGSYVFNYSCCDYYPKFNVLGENEYQAIPHDTICFNKVMFRGVMTTGETWFFDNYIWALLLVLVFMIALPFYLKSRRG